MEFYFYFIIFILFIELITLKKTLDNFWASRIEYKV